jgi:hypothetical protein
VFVVHRIRGVGLVQTKAAMTEFKGPAPHHTNYRRQLLLHSTGLYSPLRPIVPFALLATSCIVMELAC